MKGARYQVKILGNGKVSLPLEPGEKALLDRVFGLTKKELNKRPLVNREVEKERWLK